MDQAGELAERIARIHQQSADSLWWRAALGQATFDLLAAGRTVTVEALIDHLQAVAPSDGLVHKTLSMRAAINVLRPLAGGTTTSEE